MYNCALVFFVFYYAGEIIGIDFLRHSATNLYAHIPISRSQVIS